MPPGTVVTRHFQPIHRLMAGAPAPIDGILEQTRKIRDELLKLGPQAGGANPLTALTDPAVLDLWRALQRDAANLPSPVNVLVGQIAHNAAGSVSVGRRQPCSRRSIKERSWRNAAGGSRVAIRSAAAAT